MSEHFGTLLKLATSGVQLRDFGLSLRCFNLPLCRHAAPNCQTHGDGTADDQGHVAQARGPRLSFRERLPLVHDPSEQR